MINDNPVDLGVHYSQTKPHHVHNIGACLGLPFLTFLFNQAWFILTHRVLVSLGFLGLTFDCLTLILVGDKRVRNLSKRHTLTYIIHLYTSCERTNTGRIRTGHLGVTCFCCHRFLQNLRSHGVKANARSHDATWDAGTRTPLPVAQRHHAAPLSHLQVTWINIRINMVVSSIAA
jgi:hypothetical protein